MLDVVSIVHGANPLLAVKEAELWRWTAAVRWGILGDSLISLRKPKYKNSNQQSK